MCADTNVLTHKLMCCRELEKRPGETGSPGRPEKKRKVEEVEDISESTIAEIIATIEDPRGMVGPQVTLLFGMLSALYGWFIHSLEPKRICEKDIKLFF